MAQSKANRKYTTKCQKNERPQHRPSGLDPGTGFGQRMLADIQLHGFAKGTQKNYIDAVRTPAHHYRIISISHQDDKITFQCKNSKTYKTKKMSLQTNEFIRRFLQHLLPKGFHKVRFYGLWSSGHRSNLFNIKRTK